jgi:hypothetical protein
MKPFTVTLQPFSLDNTFGKQAILGTLEIPIPLLEFANNPDSLRYAEYNHPEERDLSQPDDLAIVVEAVKFTIPESLQNNRQAKLTSSDQNVVHSMVRGVQLSESELQQLEIENDRITVTLDGQIVELEQSVAQASFPDSLLKPSGIIVENQGNVFERLPGSVIPPSTIFANNSLSGTGEPSFVPLSIDLQNRLMANAQTATIQVTYHDFTPQAQAAFDYAAKIWSSLIVAAVPITIDAYYKPLAPRVIAQVDTLLDRRNFPGAQPNTWYTAALANQFAGQDLYPDYPDMASTLSSNVNWYFGTDGKTPANQYDLVTVALHELLHGLGTIGLMQYSNGRGSWGYDTGSPAIYDRFIENGSGQSLIDTNVFPNPSFALGDQLTSDDLFFDGANAVGANCGNRPKLYAPSIWEDGSSIYHLDENTYPQGNPNSLNTPFLNAGESIHDPGPITLGILRDEGWNLINPVTPVPTLTPPLDTPLFRFQNTCIPGTYLFAGAEEAASIRQNYKNFREEGFAFGVATSQTDPLLQPFYRFQNTSMPGTYLYAGAQEAASIRQNYRNFYEEGLAFYAYGAGVGLGTAFNRFQNTSLPGTYLFAGPSETESILANYPNFHLEGIAFEAGG